ncbi:MAG: tetratricopeptide repeat protein [Treponema sp.]|jgi:tetratricopeptide (TPR) repeat protein|nr:tetratricopeptide repeat protein [Treponema sp.]
MSEQPALPAGRIVFLAVPENIRGRIESLPVQGAAQGYGEADSRSGDPYAGEFQIRPEIPIPAELPGGEGNFSLENLSQEMILAGMLKVLAAGESVKEGRPEGFGPRWLDYYRRFVLALRPDILPEFSEAAILKAKNGDYELSLEIFDALKGLFPHSPEVLLNSALALEEKAAALERRGQEEGAERESAAAEQAYAEVLALEPPFPDAFFNAAYFYLKRRDFARAKALLNAYLDLSPASEDKEENARALIKEIEETCLDDGSFREAWDLVRRGREEEGLESIRSFLGRYPSVWHGWFVLGWALRRLGRWEDAKASFEKTLELGGDNGDTRNELSICLIELEDYPAARRHLETALRADPENIKIISNLGVLAMKSGDDDEAAGFFRSVLELESGDPVARRYFGMDP